MKRRVAVVGAGWSGLACALELAGQDFAVSLFDAAPQVGGRARAASLAIGDRRYALDNGQHLLVGAYGETLRLMRRCGVDTERALLRLPFELRYPDGFLLRAQRLPPPLHLAAALALARQMDWAARWQPIGFVHRWQRRGWRLDADAPASTLFAGAPAQVVRRLWRPLCLAALNVELQQASAQVLLNVLRDALASSACAADLLIPRRDLTQVFARPAASTLAAAGADIRLRRPVQHLARRDGCWHIASRGTVAAADAVVLALPPANAAALLASAGEASLQATIAELRSVGNAPIATVYLRYPPDVRLPWPVCALLDDPANGRFGQWVFDRGRLDEDNAGVLAVVISGASAALLDAGPLASRVAAQLADDLRLPSPLASAVVTEKRATIVPSPGLRRPAARLAAPSLYLAGDAANSEYPSTLEGSVRAGLAAARALLADRG